MRVSISPANYPYLDGRDLIIASLLRASGRYHTTHCSKIKCENHIVISPRKCQNVIGVWLILNKKQSKGKLAPD
jgi:hypothetical protein